MSSFKISVPNLTGEAEADVRTLYSALIEQRKLLEYLFNNDDLRISGNSASIIETNEAVDIVSSSVAGNSSSILSQAGQISLMATDISDNTSSIQVLSNGIALMVSDVEDNAAAILVNSQNINLAVMSDDVINSINLSTEGITINANRLDISGLVSFTDLSTAGQTTINGDNIVTGSLTSINLIGGDLYSPNQGTHVNLDSLGNVTFENLNYGNGFVIECNTGYQSATSLHSKQDNDQYEILITSMGTTYPTNIWDFSAATVTGIDVVAIFG